MAEFSRLVITGKGQALLAKMIAEGCSIEFTKVSASGAEYTDAQLEGLTELSEIRQTSLISRITRTNEVAIKVEAAFTNTELTEGYYMRALGLYANDSDAGEILYAVTREVSGNCYMPAYNGVTVSGAYVQLVTAVGNAENVTLEVDSGAYATMGDIKTLEAKISELNGQLGGAGASGDIGFAEGIEADNVIGAINEVFQSGNEKKGKLVENLVAMGIEASTDETWESLLNKVLDMTDTSGDTVTAEALLSGYTAHNAAGEQITGAMPDKRGTTVTAAAVTQDDEYTYLSLPEGEACYSGDSKVRTLNSDLPSNVYYVGEQTGGSQSYDITTMYPNYTTLTKENFVFAASYADGGGPDVNSDSDASWHPRCHYTITMSYNNETGLLTVNSGGYSWDLNGGKGSYLNIKGVVLLITTDIIK